jgi:hypothetical protein
MRLEVMFPPLLILAKGCKDSFTGFLSGTTCLAVATAELTNFK